MAAGCPKKKYHDEFYHSARKIIGAYEGEDLYTRSSRQDQIEQDSDVVLLQPSRLELPNYGYRIRKPEYLEYPYAGGMEFTIGLKFREPRSPKGIEELENLISLKDVSRLLYGFEKKKQDPKVPYRQISPHTIIDLDHLRDPRHLPALLNPKHVRPNTVDGGSWFGIYDYEEFDCNPPIVVYSNIALVHLLSKAVEDRWSAEDREAMYARVENEVNDQHRKKLAAKFRRAFPD